MNMRKSRTSLIASLLVVAFAGVSLQVPAHAAMVTAQDIAAERSLQTERNLLQERLLREDVKSELQKLGVDPQQVEERIDRMTLSELSQVNGQLDAMPAGGDGLGTVALVLLILILLEITGAIDIFPRI